MAFQNPATIHGKVIANSTISTRSIALNPLGDNANVASTTSPDIETVNSAANSTRRPVMEFSAASSCLD